RRRERGFVAPARHPPRRAWTRIRLFFRQIVLLWPHVGPRLQRSWRGSRPGRRPRRIILPDQPCELRKRIALAATLVGGGKRSVLISISHRDDASPSGQRQPRHVKQTMTSVAPARYPTDPHP